MFLEWCSIKASWWIFFPTCNWKEPDILPWSQKMSVVNKKFVKKMSTSRILRRFPFTPKWLRKKILDCVKNVIWQVFFTILDNQITIFSNQIYFPFPSKAKKLNIRCQISQNAIWHFSHKYDTFRKYLPFSPPTPRRTPLFKRLLFMQKTFFWFYLFFAPFYTLFLG